MARNSNRHRWVCLCLLGLAWPATAQEGDNQPATQPAPDARPQRALDLTGPRATLREFLLAIQDADADQPERIDDAVRCMNTSALTGDDAVERARQLARRLHKLIQAKHVKLEDIPDRPEDGFFVFFQGEPVEDLDSAPEIRLERSQGFWRFTPHTLASVPALESQVKQQAAPKAPVSDVPAARRTAQATMRTFLDAMNAKPKPDTAQAVSCLDPTGQDFKAWPVSGPDLATKIKNVMDKTKVVLLAEIPDEPDGDPFIFYTHEKGSVVIGRVEEEVKDPDGAVMAQKGEWRFTPQTLKTIDVLYLEFEDQPILSALVQAGVQEKLPLGLRIQRAMPHSLRTEYMGLEGWKWLGLALLLAAGWLVKYVAALVTGLFGNAWMRRKGIDLDRKVRRRLHLSLGTVAMVVVWWHVVSSNYLQLTPTLLTVLLPLTKFGVAVSLGWFGFRVVDGVGSYLTRDPELRLTHFDDVLIPLLRGILRFVVWVVVILFVLTLFNVTMTKVWTALGIGGLAVAFAAKDSLGNFFGSLTVLFDRPFGIGDWINVGGVDGTVEQVGFRSTRVRTFYNSVVSIPNSEIANTRVDNYGARRYRRATATLGLTYDTPPEKIDAFCEGVRELIRLHPYTRKDYYHVYFNGFGPSSLDIMLYLFLDAPDWSTELREKHRLYVDILRLAQRLGVEFAFPTQTLWVHQAQDDASQHKVDLSVPDLPAAERVGVDHAAKTFQEAYGPKPASRGPVVIEGAPRSRKPSENQDG